MRGRKKEREAKGEDRKRGEGRGGKGYEGEGSRKVWSNFMREGWNRKWEPSSDEKRSQRKDTEAIGDDEKKGRGGSITRLQEKWLAWLMLPSLHLHMKSIGVCIK